MVCVRMAVVVVSLDTAVWIVLPSIASTPVPIMDIVPLMGFASVISAGGAHLATNQFAETVAQAHCTASV